MIETVENAAATQRSDGKGNTTMMLWIIAGLLIYLVGAIALTMIAAAIDKQTDEWDCAMVGIFWPIILPFVLITIPLVIIVSGLAFLLEWPARSVRTGRETKG